MVVSMATTCVETAAKFIALPLDVSKDGGSVCHSDLPDYIRQVHLPL